MADHGERGFHNILKVLRHRGFLYYTIGSLSSQIGNHAYRVAAGWLMWDLTHSAIWLGILGFAQQVSAVVSPLAGAMADRMDRLFLTRLSQFLLFVQGAALAALTLFDLATAGLLAFLSLIQGLLASIDQPARYALYPTLIGPDDLTTAVAVDSITFNTARLIGPLIAGYAIVHYDTSLAFMVNAVSYGIFCLCLCLVSAPAEAPRPARRSNLIEDMREGFRYGFRHPGIGPMLSLLAITTMLSMPLQHLLPGYTEQVFRQGAVGLSWLNAVMGLGAMIGALWMARKGDHFGLTGVMVRSLLFAGLAMLLLTATDFFWVGLIAVGFSGVCSNLSRGASQTLIQNAVEGRMRGRVISLFSMIFRAGPALGALVMGLAAEAFGFRTPLVVAGILLVVAWGWALRRSGPMVAALEVDSRERVR